MAEPWVVDDGLWELTDAGVFGGLQQILLAAPHAAEAIDWSQAAADAAHRRTKGCLYGCGQAAVAAERVWFPFQERMVPVPRTPTPPSPRTPMELRQLRYFITLAEELHFGRAAAREHIVQSALSQQIRRLEREVGVLLFVRDTHRVEITPAGEAFLAEARRILARLDLAVAAARDANHPVTALRAGVGDASFDSMHQILEAIQTWSPSLKIHQVEAGVPEQYRLLAEDRLDVGFGRASLMSDAVASDLVRLDPMGVAVAASHPYAELPQLPVARLATETVLLAEADRSPEYNTFVLDQCRAAGFVPKLYRGTVQSMRGAADLVARRRCVVVIPSSCSLLAGVVWVPLVEPSARYPFSLLWWDGSAAAVIGAVRTCARTLSSAFGWLNGTDTSDGIP